MLEKTLTTFRQHSFSWPWLWPYPCPWPWRSPWMQTHRQQHVPWSSQESSEQQTKPIKSMMPNSSVRAANIVSTILVEINVRRSAKLAVLNFDVSTTEIIMPTPLCNRTHEFQHKRRNKLWRTESSSYDTVEFTLMAIFFSTSFVKEV
jgi:hypothetical protein